MTFSSDELSRYQRHLALAGFGPAAQGKLKTAKVLVIGAGGLGCPALLYLAAAGVGKITLIDADVVEVSNLQRQVLYAAADAGRPKAEAAAARLRTLNGLIEIVPLVARFTRDNAPDLVRAHDVVIDGSDNFATRYLANDACVMAGRPLVYGAIHAYEGQASVFNWRGGPTYRCLFPEPPAGGTMPNCAEAGVIGVLPGLIGTLQATEAIKLITGIGEPLSGRLLLWDALTMKTRTLRIAADPANHAITELPPADYGATGVLTNGRSEADEITAGELAGRIASVQLIDVREGGERVLGAIDPSVHVPLGELAEETVAGLSTLDRKQPTVVYCAAGARSLRALDLLRERHGFESVVSLRGGYREWNVFRS